jgi:hypothetical protein
LAALVHAEPSLLTNLFAISRPRMHLIGLGLAHLSPPLPPDVGPLLLRGPAWQVLDRVLGQPRRMTALELDWDKLASVRPSTVRELVERCTTCESPEQCEWDLREDPSNPAWQAYCPNAATLMALARPPASQMRTQKET